jgi:Zn-dependent peptidase ImmA (M78 family)
LAIKLRRGFKTEAEAYATEFRKDLLLRPFDPLDMFSLAEHLAIPTHPLSVMKNEIKASHYALLTESFKSPMSGMTLHFGSVRKIVYNDAHAPTRQQSDLAHELAHAILGHAPSELTKESGGRHFDKELEDEANCLSGVLLVPRAAAISVVASGISLEAAAKRYNVSPAMMRMQLNNSGARQIFARSRLAQKRA